MNKFQEISKIADIHVKRIESSKQHLTRLFPINSKTINTLQEEDLAWLDMLINRFEKLQDLIGAKLIDIFLEEKGETIENLSVLDKINKLERLKIIENSQLWQKMREARNHIAHEYPDSPMLTARYLNQIFELTPKLLDIYNQLKNRYIK